MALSGARRAVAVTFAALLAATAANLVVPTYPGYDTYANLVWGKTLAEGTVPDLTERLAPTPHPLEILAGVLVSPFGAGDRMLVVLVLASFLALLAGMFAFARQVVGPASAAVATALVAVNPTLLVITVRGGADTPFLACVVWALALAAREHRAPDAGLRRRVLLLLLTGGLLRPEAWGLALLYLAVTSWRRRAVAAVEVALALAAPVVWSAMDWALTGDPAHSLTSTTALADDLGRSRPATEAPLLLVKALAHLLTPPVLALAIIGAGLAIATRQRLRLELPLALLAAGVGAYLAIVAGGFSAVDRYAWLAALPLIVLAGYALGGFTLVTDPLLRRRWLTLAGGAVAVGLAGVVVWQPNVGRVQRELVDEPRIHHEYATLLGRAAVRDAARCGPVTVDGYYRVYEARWDLGRPTAPVQAPPADPRQGGVLFSTVSDLQTLPAAVRATLPRFEKQVRQEEVPGLVAHLSCDRR
jgi:hypothetical protein